MTLCDGSPSLARPEGLSGVVVETVSFVLVNVSSADKVVKLKLFPPPDDSLPLDEGDGEGEDVPGNVGRRLWSMDSSFGVDAVDPAFPSNEDEVDLGEFVGVLCSLPCSSPWWACLRIVGSS